MVKRRVRSWQFYLSGARSSFSHAAWYEVFALICFGIQIKRELVKVRIKYG